MEEDNKPKGKQGFASMPRDKQYEIVSKGGRAVHQKLGRAALPFLKNKKLASRAGSKGGKAPHVTRGRVSAKADL